MKSVNPVESLPVGVETGRLELKEMAYFSRLTDIVTCSITEILAKSDDPLATIDGIVREMQEGLAGASRSVATAAAAVERISREMAEYGEQVDRWMAEAKAHLAAGEEAEARMALERKQEVADLIAGLEQQHQAAVATRDHLTTTLRALEARLAEAERRRAEMHSHRGESPAVADVSESAALSFPSARDADRAQRIEEELAALRKELEG